MTLFNYSKCECCNNKNNDINFTLYNLLPANLCNKVSEYDVYCSQCCITRDLEKFFVEEHKDKGYTKFQLQLTFFMKYQKRCPVCFYHTIDRESFEKEIDEFFNNKDLIKRFGGTSAIKPYKAFVKKFRGMFDAIDWHLLSKDKINEVLNEFKITKYHVWSYYNTKYQVWLLVNLFFWEYIYSIIGKDNIKYIDIGDIDKYVDYIFEDIFPDYKCNP